MTWIDDEPGERPERDDEEDDGPGLPESSMYEKRDKPESDPSPPTQDDGPGMEEDYDEKGPGAEEDYL